MPDRDHSPARWTRIEEIYSLALEATANERETLLARACGTDVELKREVESLLAAHDAAPDFLISSAVDVAADLLSKAGEADVVGRCVGPYEITAWIGAGGMGDVYRAHDARLRRDVALKVLPPLFAQDTERLAAFAREAQVLASISHTNIAAIYGLEQAPDVQALVLELVEGVTLAERLSKGPVPVDEAMTIARQIAEGLEAAHERGIVHRDLKPSNVAVRQDGGIKLLDFGIATALQRDGVAGAAPAPFAGTPAYASPEQMKGQAADKRSDIWAFGAVFYEMLTGRRAVQTAADPDRTSMPALDPQWDALPLSTPPAVRHLLTRCLEPDPRRRLRDIGEARIILEPSASGASARALETARMWPRRIALVIAGAALATSASAAVWFLTRPSQTRPAVARFTHALPDGQVMDLPASRHAIAISPDGTSLAYLANHRVQLRSMADLGVRTIPGVEFEDGVTEPVFSPDGRSLAFWVSDDATIKRIDLAGGSPVTMAHTENPFGMTWSASGLLFGRGRDGIWRVRKEGLAPEQVVRVEEGEEAHGPQLLPGGEHVLFTLATGSAWGRWSEARVVVQSLTSGQRKVLIDGGSDARLLPSGHLVYAKDITLFAVPFDAARLELTGAPVAMIEGVRTSANRETGAAQFDVSSNGTLLYMPGPRVGSEWGPQQLLIADRTGRVEPVNVPPGPYRAIRVSPDGARIALGQDDGREGRIYTYALSGSLPMQRLTFDGHSYAPVWTPDGARLTFQSSRDGVGGLFWQRADGAGNAERLTRAEEGESHTPEAWSPDGRWLLFSRTRGNQVRLWVLSRIDGQLTPFGDVESIFPLDARFSPDGHWVAYSQRNNHGQMAIFVQPFPATGAKYEVRVKGARATPHKPMWSPNGRELFYIPRLSGFEAVPVLTHPSFAVGEGAPVVRPFGPGAPSVRALFDVMKDGRFVGMRPAGDFGPIISAPEVQVVLNWFEELEARVPINQR